MSRRSMERARARREKSWAGRRKSAAIAATAAAGATIALAAPAAEAANFTVSNLGDSGAGSLRDAIVQANAAVGPDTITFQSGLSGTINVGTIMNSTDALDIQGPGPGVITLDGGDATPIFTSGPAPCSISGLTFTDGSAPGGVGGAISLYGDSKALDDLVVTSSTANRGGGVYISGNDFTVTNSRLTDNVATYTGGAFATDGYSGVDPSDAATITGSVFIGNKATTAGGAISLYDQYVDTAIDSSTIADNTVVGDGTSNYENGGGIWFEDTYNGKSTTLSNSTVSGNSAPDGGGGVSFGENFYGPTTVVNSTVTGNSANSGGGIQFADIENVPFTLVDSTVTGNTATTKGGGVFRGYDTQTQIADSPLAVSSSVVSGNTAPGVEADFGVSTSSTGDLTLGNTLLGVPPAAPYTADPAGSNIVNPSPQLGALAENGGPTKTMLPDPASPAVNAGLANGLTKDQRGLQRTFDYPTVPLTHGSDGTDIGAAELIDDELIDPVVTAKKPQKQGNKVKVKLRAGAGEDVQVRAYGRIRAKKGFPVKKVNTTSTTGNQVKIVLKPKRSKDADKIQRSLTKGKKVRANITVLLKDAAGNKFEKKLSIKLKAKKPQK